jgi:hypothetical protein
MVGRTVGMAAVVGIVLAILSVWYRNEIVEAHRIEVLSEVTFVM